MFQPRDRFGSESDPDLPAMEEEPESQQRRIRGVPDRGLLPIHFQPQSPFDHVTDAIEHPVGNPFAAHENPNVIGLCGPPDYVDLVAGGPGGRVGCLWSVGITSVMI
jgi:hypothetical protein